MPTPHAPVLAVIAMFAAALPAAGQEAPRFGEITLARASSAEAGAGGSGAAPRFTAQSYDDYGYDEPRPTFLNPFPGARRAGVYGRVAGLRVEQRGDGFLRDNGQESEVTFDRGFGFLLAMGHRFGDVPLSLEVEYAYRNVSIDEAIAPDGSRRRTSGDLSLHTFATNILLDAPDLISVFGVYAGGGVGLVASQLAAESRSGDARLAVTGEDIFVQAMAGVTVSVSRKLQLYGGVRWLAAGSVEQDDGDLSVDVEVVAAEFGLRMFF